LLSATGQIRFEQHHRPATAEAIGFIRLQRLAGSCGIDRFDPGRELPAVDPEVAALVTPTGQILT
jgi:hypothetical protein